MANGLYRKACEAYSFPNIIGHTIRVSLIRTAGGYTPNLQTDQFYSIIPPAAVIFDGPALTGKTFTGGVFKADDVNFGVVPASPAADGMIIWRDTGTPATSELLVWYDTAPGLPVTPDGQNFIVVQWPPTFIFRL
jgi:hypothetical protein